MNHICDDHFKIQMSRGGVVTKIAAMTALGKCALMIFQIFCWRAQNLDNSKKVYIGFTYNISNTKVQYINYFFPQS